MALREMTMIVALGAAGLAGCSLGGPPAQVFSQFGLYFNQDDQSASLAYGKANSDEVGLMLQCAKGSRLINVTDVARSTRADRLILTSGTRRLELPVTVNMDETGAPLANAIIPMDSPVLKGFRNSGDLAVTLGSLHYGVNADHNRKSPVALFFAACEQS